MNKVFWLVSVDRSKKDSVNWSQSSQNIMHWKEAGIQWLEVCILGCRDSRCDGSERHVSVVCLCEWMRGRSLGKQGQIVEDLICHGKKSDDKSFKNYQQEVWAGSSVRVWFTRFSDKEVNSLLRFRGLVGNGEAVWERGGIELDSQARFFSPIKNESWK